MKLEFKFKRVLKHWLSRMVTMCFLLLFKVYYLLPFRRYLDIIHMMIRQSYWRSRLNSLGENTNIYSHVVIHSPECVKIGNNVSIAEFVHIWGGGTVEIGDYSVIAAHSIITSVTHDTNAHIYGQTLIKEAVRIGNRVWIGSGAIILAGIKIGDGAIIGAGSVVTRDIGPHEIAVGVPARCLSKAKRLGSLI